MDIGLLLDMCKNIVKNKSKNLSSKYTQKLLDLANQSTTGALKTASKKVIQKKPSRTNWWVYW